jgi:hypothetical protein
MYDENSKLSIISAVKYKLYLYEAGNWNEGEICQSFRGFAQIHKNFSFLRCSIDAIINCFYPSEKLHKYIIYFISNNKVTFYPWDHRGHDRMVVGFTTTYAINTYHH